MIDGHIGGDEESLEEFSLPAVLVAPEQLSESLFDSMVSLRDKKKQEQPHLGLGLYIARLICQFHQGVITAKNQPKNNGVMIRIVLPINS